ncbi:MAG TPA: IPT/TIG domain-containing protein [Gemmata sp.]|nr:IPT/TIG domain-containing protein [Gemmata sp.]
MSQLSRILDELVNRIPRRISGRTMSRCLVRKPHGTVRHVGRELEELERRDVPSLLGQQLFPSDNPWNQNIANAPVATNSTAIINHIGGSIGIHPDWGTDSSANGNDPLYGIPVNVVHGNSVKKVNVIIGNYASESDVEAVPIPANVVIEGDYQNGPNPNGPGYGTGQRGDSHLIIWDEDNNIAYELYEAARPTDPGSNGQWHAVQESVWNMNTNTFRSLGYTSADAAGLSILAGLVRPDEGLPVSQGGQGTIDHALRFTLPSGDINPQYIYPASHEINVSSQSSDELPMGARLRLANTPAIDALIAGMGPEAQIIATAMQQYGLILADDGSPMFVTGSSASVNANNAIDLTWDMNDVLGLESLKASDFQVLNLTPIVTGLSTSTGDTGNTITITGQNFSGAAGHLSVLFGNTQSSSVTFVSDTEITAVVPAGSGTVNVTVQSGVNEQDNVSGNPNANVNAPIFGYGTSVTSSTDLFSYITQTVSSSNSSVSFASSTDPSGTADTVTFNIVDTTGKVISGLPNSAFTLSLSGGASTGTFGTVSETATPGTYTATFSGSTAGTASTLTVAVAGVQIDSQPTVQVTPGAVSGSHSTVSFAASTDTSGMADLATILVEDAAGNAITGMTNSAFAFGLSGGTSTGTFGTVTATGTPGTYTAAFTGILAGTTDTLSQKINNVALTGQPKVTVTPGGVGGGSSSVSFASSTAISGQADTVTIVVKDAAGNAITGLTNSAFAFALGGGTSTGTFGTVTETATHGTYTTTFTGVLAGNTSTLTATVSGVRLNIQPTVQVKAGGKSTVSFANPTVASGASDTVTIVVKDAAGNTITGLASSAFVFSLAGATSTGTFGTVTETATLGTYTTTFTGLLSGTANSLALKVSGVQLTTQPQVTVTPGVVSSTKSTVIFAAATDTSGTSDTVTIVVKDAAGNAVTGLASSTFAFNLASGTSTGSFGTVTETATKGTYTAAFTGAIAGTASTLTLNINGVQIATEPKVTVKVGAVSSVTSTVSLATSTVASAKTDKLTIVVKDAGGNAIGGLASTAFVLSLSGGVSTGTFSAVTATMTPGTYTATFTGVIAGTASDVNLKINSVAIATHPTVQVTPGVVGSVRSTMTVATTSVASGATDLVAIVVKDHAKNAISGLSNSDFVFSFAGGKSTATIGTVTETAIPGTYTVLLTGVAAGTASTLTVKINGVLLTSEPKVTVKAGAVSGTVSTVILASPTVATGLTDKVTISVKDAAGNAVGRLTSNAFLFDLSGGTSTGTFGTVTATTTPGVYTVLLKGGNAGTAGTLTVEVDGISLTTKPTIQVM